uniref:Sulfotransferase n=1 Tax=Gasterosteus aculeatus aculeatus TaxID=481459 RepID=G3P5C6_GASAC
MSLPHRKHGSKEHTYSRHWLPLSTSCGKTPERTLFDFRLWVTNLRSVSKGKVVSFLMGLTLMFLIMASHILTWDRKGLFLTSPPYQRVRAGAVPNSTGAAEDLWENVRINMKLLVKIIGSKLEYTPRKVPEEKDVIGTNSRLFSAIPRHFLPGVKSPCWYQEFSGELGTDPYKGNQYAVRTKSFEAVCGLLRADFHKHLHPRGGKLFRLRCLPFFYIVGQPKCGTTDLFYRLRLHPEVKFNTIKEPHWWTRKRFGYIRFKDGYQENFPLEDYLDLFDLAAHNIEKGISGNSSGDHRTLITGEASASTMWDNQAWSYLHKEEPEPPFLAQDVIHTVQPGAKIIIMLRDPVERLYSDYLYFKMANKSTEDFHQKVVESVQLFQSCLSERSLRSCAYNTSLSNAMPVRLNLGMYVVFLLDWLTVFHSEQILVLRLEDYAANLQMTINKVLFRSKGRQRCTNGPNPTPGGGQTGSWDVCFQPPVSSSGNFTNPSTINWPACCTTKTSTGATPDGPLACTRM